MYSFITGTIKNVIYIYIYTCGFGLSFLIEIISFELLFSIILSCCPFPMGSIRGISLSWG